MKGKPTKGAKRSTPPPASLLAAALGAMAEGVMIAGRTWRKGGLEIIHVNDSLCLITGHGAGDLRGRSHGMLHADQAHFAELRRWLRKTAPGLAFSGEGYLARRSGEPLYAAWTFSPIADRDGSITHLAVTYRDMTAQRRLQEALIHAQRLDAHGQLAGGVAHDFNNLLSVINGYCEILGSKPDVRRRAAREIGEIHRAGQHAAGLVRQLLAFSRRQAMDPKVVSLNRLVRDNSNILTKLLQPDKLVALDLGAEHDRVRVDSAQLQQVLLNLTLNARDALHAGGEVGLRTGFREIGSSQNRRLGDVPPGRYVTLAVSDNGMGMDEETKSHLFEPFFTTKPPGLGTGLGLALVYGVIQQSGGFIFVESALGVGTTFEILLPAVEEAEQPEPPLPSALPATRGSETVLLLEEDTVVRKMVAGILTADGYRVLAAGTVEDALRLGRLADPAVGLFIASLGRPEGEAAKLGRTLLAVHPGLRVLSTSGQEPLANLVWLPKNSQGALVKPYALSTLLRAVRSLLDGDGMPAAPPHFSPKG